MVSFFRFVGIKNFIFLILAILFLIFLAQIKDIAILFFAAFVIACSLNPIVDKLCTYRKISRPLASILTILGTLFIGVLFLIPIIVTGGEQIHSFVEAMPRHLEHLKGFFNSTPFLTQTDVNNIDLGGFVSSASGMTSDIVNSSIAFSKNIASFLIYFLAACIIIYYFLADSEAVRRTYLLLFPKPMKKRAEEILDSISQKVGGYVLAQVVTIASLGLIVFLGLALIGVDYALILGLITAIFDLVPIIGPAVAFVIILISVLKMSALKIGLVILIFAFAQWAENSLVRPYVFGKLLNLHPLIIYFFILVTAQFFGLIGVVFAPAIAATVCVLLEELYIKNVN